MRTFIAIELPEAVREVLRRVQDPLSKLPGVRLARPEQCHLTLKFLGEIDEGQCATFIGGLSKVRFAEFQLSLTSVGTFPNARRPRVIWVGVSSPPELALLAQAVDRATSAILLDKPFAAHITLARINTHGVQVDSDEFGRQAPPCSFAVRGFAFYRSVQSPAGSRYEVLHRFELDHGKHEER
jgi:2'-5' RNA ligase